MPGYAVSPIASICSALGGAETLAPIAMILPALITIDPLGISGPFTGTMRTFRIRYGRWGPGRGL